MSPQIAESTMELSEMYFNLELEKFGTTKQKSAKSMGNTQIEILKCDILDDLLTLCEIQKTNSTYVLSAGLSRSEMVTPR